MFYTAKRLNLVVHANLKLERVDHVPAGGESRRLMGDYILTENDVRSGKVFADAVALCSGHFCLHYPGDQYYYVLGNHCVSALTKLEFLEIVGQKASYYSFDANGVHFVVLDACFRSDGQPYGRKNFEWTDSNIPAAEVEWLIADLNQTIHKSVVFVHQRLDVEPPLGIENTPEVRKVLEESGKVLAVLQGHDHQGDYKEIEGVPYCTLISRGVRHEATDEVIPVLVSKGSHRPVRSVPEPLCGGRFVCLQRARDLIPLTTLSPTSISTPSHLSRRWKNGL